MATEGQVPPRHGSHPRESMDKGLKKDAIGYVSNIVIGVASTAPAYSLAATLGFIVAVKGVGVHAPARAARRLHTDAAGLLGLQYLNKRGPRRRHHVRVDDARLRARLTGWINGWAIFLADLIVMASLSDIAAIYTFKLFGFTELANRNAASSRRRSCGSP